MKLRDKLLEILPRLLPLNESEAIKGKELIHRVRAELGDQYSDQSLRSQFSFLVLAEDSCLARVENGQGYFLRATDAGSRSLHSMFEANVSPEAEDPYRKALALSVRLYDSAGYGVFVYPVEDEESWVHADFVAVQWPDGRWEDGAYVFDELVENQEVRYCSVCVAVADSAESCRRAFFRALACGGWADECELLLLGLDDLPEEELCDLSARYGVGVKALGLDEDLLEQIGGADVLFRARADELSHLLESIPQRRLAASRLRKRHVPSPELRPDVETLLRWVELCLLKGRLESYELRVAVN